MTETVTISLIGAITTVMIGALNAAIALSVNRRSKENTEHIKTLVNQTDGLQTAVLDNAKSVAFKQGIETERTEHIARQEGPKA